MSEKPWEVVWQHGMAVESRFETFDAAERFAKRVVKRDGKPRYIGCHPNLVANVCCDALGRVWVDVLDTALA